MSDKLISLIRATLRLLAKHFNSVVGEAPIQETKMDFEDQQECGDIVFVLNTYLNLPDVEVKPSIDEVQNMLNTAGKIIISVTRGVGQWRQIKKKTGKVEQNNELVGTLQNICAEFVRECKMLTCCASRCPALFRTAKVQRRRRCTIR